MTAVPTVNVEELQAENKRLALRVKALEKELYGSRADRRKPEDPNQTTFAEVENAGRRGNRSTQTCGTRPQRAQKAARKAPGPINPDLPRVEERIADPDLKELICPVTGMPMKTGFRGKDRSARPQTRRVLVAGDRATGSSPPRKATRWPTARGLRRSCPAAGSTPA